MKPEIVRAHNMFRVPEIMQALICMVIGAIFAGVLYIAATPRPQTPKQELYIVAKSEFLTDSGVVYTLEYAIDGDTKFPVNFPTKDQREDYIAWLAKITNR
jgi:hypothetical protein